MKPKDISAILVKTKQVQDSFIRTAKKQYRKFETNIPRKGIARPQSQFPHSCVCGRFLYSHDRSAYSSAGNLWTDPGNKSLTDT
jgi:hypothetical protein